MNTRNSAELREPNTRASLALAALLRSSFLRYLVTGGLSAVVEYGSFMALLRGAGIGYLWAHGISVYAGFVCSFFINKLWSFRNRAPVGRQFLKANMLLVFNMLATSLIMAGLVSGAGMAAPLAKFICMCAVVLWNFLVFRNVIFRHRPA